MDWIIAVCIVIAVAWLIVTACCKVSGGLAREEERKEHG